MANTNTTSSSTKTTNPKKANLDHNSIKHLLHETVAEIVKSREYPEDVRLNNLKLLLGTIIISIALFVHFCFKKFPRNRDFLIGCITLDFHSFQLLQCDYLVMFTDFDGVHGVERSKFTKDGILVEGLFWKDVNRLIDEYSAESSKNK